MGGRWELDLEAFDSVSSLLTSAGISGTVRFNTVRASSTGLPASAGTKLAHGVARTATIHVTNTGSQPEAYLIDARRNGLQPLALQSLVPTTSALPNTNFGLIPQFVLPPFSPAMAMAATSTVPITMDTSPDVGAPDVEAFSAGSAAVAVVTAPELPASVGLPAVGAGSARVGGCGADDVQLRRDGADQPVRRQRHVIDRQHLERARGAVVLVRSADPPARSER